MFRGVLVVMAVMSLGIAMASETRIELVYFGGAGCGLCKNEDLRATMRKAIAAIEQESRRRGWTFEAIAVSVDDNQEHGRTFLKTYCDEFSTHVCTGHGFKTDLFQEIIMRAPALQEGVSLQVEGVPYLAVVRRNGTQTVLARYLSGTIVPFLHWIADTDPVNREDAFACLFDQRCPGVASQAGSR